MAVGLPAMVVGYGGPAELVTPRTGWLIPIGSRESIIAGLRRELKRLAANPSKIDRSSKAARDRVWNHFTWEKKAAATVSVYKWVLGHGPKPMCTMPVPDDADHAGAEAPGELVASR